VPGAVIAVPELFRTSQLLTNETARAVPVFLGAALGYLLLTIPSGFAFQAIERRVAVKR
jgi:ABC-type amino acid transport system permease subunit